MFGARAVVPVFRRQHGGVLINVGSILSKIGQPFVPSYVISKFALRGLTEVLRVELAEEPNVHVCTVMPYAIDTPHFESGANEMGLRPRGMPPIQSPEAVARAIVRIAERPHRERHVPRLAVLGLALHALMPATTELLLLRALRAWHFDPTPEGRKGGNLYQPEPVSSVHGHRRPRLGFPAFMRWMLREIGRVERDRLRGRLVPWRAAHSTTP